MAVYKLKRVTDSGTEDVSISVAMVDGAVDTTSSQTISGDKKFTNASGISTNRIHNLNGNAVYDFDGTNVRLGQTTLPLHLRGKDTRPKYTTDGTTFQELARYSDVKTWTVVDSILASDASWKTSTTNWYYISLSVQSRPLSVQCFDSSYNAITLGTKIEKVTSGFNLYFYSCQKITFTFHIIFNK